MQAGGRPWQAAPRGRHACPASLVPLAPHSTTLSCMLRRKLLHVCRQLLHTLNRHAVVDGGAHAAHAAVALELDLQGGA